MIDMLDGRALRNTATHQRQQEVALKKEREASGQKLEKGWRYGIMVKKLQGGVACFLGEDRVVRGTGLCVCGPTLRD